MATVLYTSRCNWRCPFCHNPGLALGKEDTVVTEEEAIGSISSRLGFIDGVVITGGEPTVQKGLPAFIDVIKGTGLKVKLDTNGSRPGVLEKLLSDNKLDFIAMDIKTSPEKYERATGSAIDFSLLERSIELIKGCGIDFEFRTTCVPRLVEEEDIFKISRMIGKGGCYTIQQFQPRDTLDPEYGKVAPYSRERLLGFLETAAAAVKTCRVTGM